MKPENALDNATYKSTLNTKPATQPSLTPQQAQRLAEIKSRAGWIPPDQAIALAKAAASDAAVDAVADMKGRQIIDDQASEEPEGGWARRNLYNPFKAGLRWTQAALNFLPEFVQGGVAQFGKPGDTLFQDGWFNATSLGTMIQNPEARGEGFFISDKAAEIQGERARRYRGTVGGSAWTGGRSAASLVFKENSLPYNILSGVIDAAIAIKMDPTGAVTKLVKAARKGKFAVPLLAAEEVNPIREALESEAGVLKDLAGTVLDGTKFENFTRTNPRMVTLIDRVTKEKDPLRIAEDIFDYKLPNELVAALADADDPDVVRALLASGWSVSRGALPTDIRLIQGNKFQTKVGELISQRMPMIDGIRKSRFFATTEPMVFEINGTVDDNRKAVKSVVAALRTAGVDDETVRSIANQTIRSFSSTSTTTAQKKTLDLFEGTLRSVMKTDGIADEVIENLFTVGREGLDSVRLYLVDRTGATIDNGYARHLLNQNLEYLPEDQIDTLISQLGAEKGADFHITSPLELSEMLDRTVVLPSIREIRRLTKNNFFRKLFPSTGKLPITTARVRTPVTIITDQERFDELGEEIKKLQRVRNKSDQDLDLLESLKDEQMALQQTVYRRLVTPEQRLPLMAIDFWQNRLWKPLTLATGGYVVRNSLDAQVRMAFSNQPSIFTHPFEYISLVLGSSKRMTLRLENISKVRRSAKPGEVIEEGVVTIDDLVDDVRDGLTFGMRQQGLGELDIERHKELTGVFKTVNRGQANGLELHTDGMIQNARRINRETLNRVAAQTFVEAGGVTPDSRNLAANRIARILMDPKNVKLRKEVDDLHEYGFQITSENGERVRTGSIDLRKVPKSELGEYYYQWAVRTIVDRVSMMGGNIPEANFMMAFGYTPITSRGKMVGAFEEAFENLKIVESKRIKTEDPLGQLEAAMKGKAVGAVVEIGPNRIGVITQVRNLDTGQVVIDPFDGTVVDLSRTVATVQPVHPNQSFGTLVGDSKARSLFQRMPVTEDPMQPGLPANVKRELMRVEQRGDDKKILQQLSDRLDRGTDFFFNQLYGSATRKLDRSPVFREFYYRQVGELVDRLRPEEAQKFLDEAAKAAKEANMKLEDFVGDKKIVEAMKRSTQTAGDVSLEELDDYAKFVALTETRELLYDASARSNLEDVLRVVMPFASAWREILTTYLGFLRSNPIYGARSFQRIYTGAVNADPDNDGRGFFYNDPNTGQMMFMFPASGTLSKALTGLEAPLEAPVRRFSQGLQVVPALGPMAQVSASKILPFVPEPEFVTELLLPYGSKGPLTAFNPMPGWLQKGLQTISAPTNDLSTVFGNTYVETYRALSASGDYDLNNRDDLVQMEKDAKFKARILTGFRAASQFFGPTAGATEFKIDTNEGDVFVGELIKTFYDMQANPAIGYDKAIPTFLEQFGDEVALYVSSKSKAVAEGLEATKEFQDWADQNGELISAYPTVARYLAPAGSDFSFTVWDQQIQRGERVRLSPDEIRRLAQQRIGSSLFRAARKQVGPYPSAEAREILKKYRSFLHKKYPGFPLVAEFEVGAYYNQVADLKELVLDRRVAGDEGAEAVKQYLIAREQAIAASGVSEQGFRTARSAERYRMGLEALALSLSERYPNFARIYDRLLASEVE